MLRRVSAYFAPAVRLGSARPAPATGLRAAVATVVPLAIGHALGTPSAGIAALAGFLTTIADKGGSYRTRATAQGALAISAATAAVVGAMAGGGPWVTPPLTFVIIALCGFALSYGTAAGSVGISTAIVFVASLASPAPAADAFMRGALVFSGAAWAMVLALGLWPVRPYRPARRTVASSYRTTAALVEEVAAHAGLDRGESWHTELAKRSGELRAAIEAARGVLAVTRRGRFGESRRGERLLVLLEAEDQIFGLVLALSEVLDARRATRATPDPLSTAVQTALGDLAAATRDLATLVEREGEGGGSSLPASWDGPSRVRVRIEQLPPDARLDTGAVVALFDRLREFWGVARDAARGIAGLRVPREDATSEPVKGILAPFVSNLSPRSVVFRHAIRMACTATAAVTLTHALGLKRGYWVTIAAIVIVQPYLGASTTKGLQRIMGTIAGCALTAVLAWLVHANFVAVAALVFALAGVGVAMSPLNYAVYTTFTTATFVLLAEATASDWHLVGTRVTNTLLGGAIALLASRLLWPERELSRFPTHMASALRANADYLDTVIRAVAEADPNADVVARARRNVGLATINAEASFQRLLVETPNDDGLVEPIMSLLVFNRRLSRGLTAMLTTATGETSELTAFGAATVAGLRELADALDEGRSPAPFVAPPGVGADSLAESATRRLRIMNQSAGRLVDRAAR